METATADKTYATLDDINHLCDSFIEMSEIQGHPKSKLKDLYFFGSLGPIQLTHNNIRIDKDNNARQRVIATSDIPKGVIVTHYPVHAIGLDHRIQIGESEKGDELFLERIQRYAMSHSRYLSLREKDDPTENTPIGILVIGNPGNTRNPLLLGHVIKDAVGNPFESIPFHDVRDWITFKNKVATYYMNGVPKQNCHYVSNTYHTLLSIESIRPIKEGEELYLLYGAEFWFHKTYDKEDDKSLCNFLFEMLADDKEFTQWLKTLYK